jgi:hypothetical protein
MPDFVLDNTSSTPACHSWICDPVDGKASMLSARCSLTRCHSSGCHSFTARLKLRCVCLSEVQWECSTWLPPVVYTMQSETWAYGHSSLSSSLPSAVWKSWLQYLYFEAIFCRWNLSIDNDPMTWKGVQQIRCFPLPENGSRAGFRNAAFLLLLLLLLALQSIVDLSLFQNCPSPFLILRLPCPIPYTRVLQICCTWLKPSKPAFSYTPSAFWFMYLASCKDPVLAFYIHAPATSI